MIDVLDLLLRAWEENIEVHGWLIMKTLGRSGPAVYGVLDRLEDAGWTTSAWQALPEGKKRPRRRLYRLTAYGVEAARQHVPLRATRYEGGLRLKPGFAQVVPLNLAA
jgi:DNA-binding PadR family transcriptional regulator